MKFPDKTARQEADDSMGVLVSLLVIFGVEIAVAFTVWGRI